MPVALGNLAHGIRAAHGRTGERRHALENRVQPLEATPTDVDFTQKEIGDYAEDRQHAHHHHPRDPGGRVAMGSKEDAHEHGQFKQHTEGNGDQRVVKRVEHGDSIGGPGER